MTFLFGVSQNYYMKIVNISMVPGLNNKSKLVFFYFSSIYSKNIFSSFIYHTQNINFYLRLFIKRLFKFNYILIKPVLIAVRNKCSQVCCLTLFIFNNFAKVFILKSQPHYFSSKILTTKLSAVFYLKRISGYIQNICVVVKFTYHTSL
jgi:hypothetical protein